MTELTLKPEGTYTSGNSRPHTYVPLERMAEHPLLRLAAVESGKLVWPGLDAVQRHALEGIHMSETHAVIPPRINFDLLVDKRTGGFAKVSIYDDVQRFYTRFTDTGFLHVGTYTAITLDGARRYFMWRSGAWDELSLSSFLHYRDGDDTNFSETDRDDIEKLSPGAVESEPVHAVTREEFNDMMLDSYFGRDPDDEMYQQNKPAGGDRVADDTDLDDSDADDEDDLMTEVDATSQHGRASAIASLAHRGQTDKLGYDYIDHPARVAANFDWLEQPVEHCVAWLHDVIEDSGVTASDLLNAGMLPDIVEAVELLTRRADVPDDDYYARIRQHPVALAVKLTDIDDNLAEWRFRKLDYDTQVKLSNKYFHARQLLTRDTSEEGE